MISDEREPIIFVLVWRRSVARSRLRLPTPPIAMATFSLKAEAEKEVKDFDRALQRRE